MEAASSNLFIVKDGVVMTTPAGPHILNGVTRDLVVELATAHNISLREEMIPEAELRSADEVWICSSNREIMPVISIDGEMVGDGKAGDVWWKMIRLFQAYKDKSLSA